MNIASEYVIHKSSAIIARTASFLEARALVETLIEQDHARVYTVSGLTAGNEVIRGLVFTFAWSDVLNRVAVA